MQDKLSDTISSHLSTNLSTNQSENLRRAYWTQQVELAVIFMDKVLASPVVDNAEPLINLVDAARDAAVEVRFSDRPHVNGLPRLYYLRQGQIAGFISAARAMNKRGWVMQVEDGFRTRQMQKFIGRQPAVFDGILKTCLWELAGKTPTADFMFRRCKSMIAYCPKVGTHMSASAIDITLFDRQTGREIDRGAPYLEMSEKTPMTSPFVSPAAMINRMTQCAIMREHGFVEYPYEFWHFNSGDCYDRVLTGNQTAAIYGPIDFDAETGKVTQMVDPEAALNTFDEIQQDISAALARY